MCRSIKTLFNFDPPATDIEVREASLQFVRKLTGFRHPAKANEVVFSTAVEKVTNEAKVLLAALTTAAVPRNREVEAKRARVRALKRFTKKS